MYVDVRGGLQGGLWAPNGCEVLEPVFVCLYTETHDWSGLGSQ